MAAAPVRIGVISDLHVDLNRSGGRDEVIPALIRAARSETLAAFLIPGDVAGDYRVTLEAVSRIEERAGIPCYFTAGNHDLWNEHHSGLSAWEAYEALRRHPSCLANGPRRLENGWVLVGDAGWYDYSFGAEAFTREDFERKSYKGRTWQDSIYAQWDRSTLEVHAWFLDKLERDLRGAGSSPVVLATHMVPITEFCVPVPHEMWDYFNAFLGSRGLGDLIRRSAAIRYACCGHVHYRKEAVKGAVRYICSCLGYRTEWELPDDTDAEVGKALRVLTLDPQEQGAADAL